MGISASEKAYNIIKEKILAGEFEPGVPLVEVELVEMTKVSRSPIREALKKLSAEGLVNTIPGKGTFTLNLGASDIHEIFELRLILEVEALRLSYKYIPLEKLENLGRVFQDIDIENTSATKFHQLDNELHSIFIDYCGNKRLQNYYYNLRDQIKMVRKISSLNPVHFETSTGFHKKIVMLLIDHKLEEAIQVLIEHIKEVEKYTLEVFEHNRYYSGRN